MIIEWSWRKAGCWEAEEIVQIKYLDVLKGFLRISIFAYNQNKTAFYDSNKKQESKMVNHITRNFISFMIDIFAS